MQSWGDGKSGQLGHGSKAPFNRPSAVLTLKGAWSASVAAGNEHSLIVMDDGGVYGSGNGTDGQLGMEKPAMVFEPTQIPSLSRLGICKIACGLNFSLAASMDGSVFSFGINSSGQLGLNDTGPRNLPTRILSLSDICITSIACGHAHSLFLSEDGHVFACGANDHGQCGVGPGAVLHPHVIESFIEAATETETETDHHAAAATIIVSMAGGSAHSAFTAKNGEVYTCGRGHCGQLGTGVFEDSFRPQRVSFVDVLTVDAIQVACGDAFTLCLFEGGSIYAFGDNGHGKLGKGDRVASRLPVRIHLPAGFRAVFIACGEEHAMALNHNGQVAAWGFAKYGQTGLGREKSNLYGEIVKFSPSKRVEAFCCGFRHNLSLCYHPTKDISIQENTMRLEKLQVCKRMARRELSQFMAQQAVAQSSISLSPSPTTPEAPEVDKHTLSVYCSSWNVNNTDPPLPEDLTLLLGASSGIDYDLVAIGLQEVVDLGAGSMYQDFKSRGSEDTDASTVIQAQKWEKAITAALGANYCLVSSTRMLGIQLIVHAKVKSGGGCSLLAEGSVPVGFLGKLPNKGALCCRFECQGLKLCFLSAHLAAGDKAVDKRNDDFRQILQKGSMTLPTQGMMEWRIMDHDLIFWIGDLNYRIRMPNYSVRNRVKDGDFSALQQFDQLSGEMKSHKVFQGFIEDVLRFAPTYKYDQWTDTYDTSEKCRTPSWCDRILYKSNLPYAITQVAYDRIDDLKQSDHRPVFSIYEIPIVMMTQDIPNSPDANRIVMAALMEPLEGVEALEEGEKQRRRKPLACLPAISPWQKMPALLSMQERLSSQGNVSSELSWSSQTSEADCLTSLPPEGTTTQGDSGTHPPLNHTHAKMVGEFEFPPALPKKPVDRLDRPDRRTVRSASETHKLAAPPPPPKPSILPKPLAMTHLPATATVGWDTIDDLQVVQDDQTQPIPPETKQAVTDPHLSLPTPANRVFEWEAFFGNVDGME
mgnify:CR=1 FL=1